MADLQFMDADGHIIEPPHDLPKFAPKGYEDKVFHVETDDEGKDWVVVGDRRIEADVFAFAAAGGLPAEEREAAHRGELRYSDMRSGGWDAQMRMADMSSDDIELSVLYPTFLLSFQSQHPLDVVVAQCQAYNDWLTEHVRDSDGRLHGVAVLPHRDPEAAAAEIERVGKRPEIVGVQVRPNPAVDWKPFMDEVYDPIWRAASEHGLPVGLHPLMSADLPGAVQGLRLHRMKTSEIPVQEDADINVDNIFFSQMIGNPVDMMSAMTFFLAGGVCKRFPELKVVFLETNGGWVVPWLERMDHHFHMYGFDIPWLDKDPSEYFRRQCWISFDADESTIPFTAASDYVGADRIVWATDYPHPDSKIPGITKELADTIAPLPEDQQQLIAGGNCRALYGI
ncbi:MAG: amidohydrolase [Acidimicrobiales bacterium]|nr:amidohydrolase [Acidimicrobiales bacterium]MCB9373363.1 amidohydrolase [Microthrixaceae bacterium]